MGRLAFGARALLHVDGVGRFHSVLGEFGRLAGDLVLVTCNVGGSR